MTHIRHPVSGEQLMFERSRKSTSTGDPVWSNRGDRAVGWLCAIIAILAVLGLL